MNIPDAMLKLAIVISLAGISLALKDIADAIRAIQ